MLCHQVVLLVFFSLLQPGRLQEEGCDDCSLFQNINSNIVNLNSLIRSYIRRFEQLRAQTEDSILSLREDLSSLSDSVSNLSMCLQELKEQTTAGAQQVNTRLDTLTTFQQCDSQPDSPTQTTITTPDISKTATPSATPISPTSQPTPLTPTIPTYTCGGTGWRRAVYLNMTDPSTTCPSGWQLTGYSKRTCGRATNGQDICDSVTFPVSGEEYNRVCGRIKAYQWGGTDAFFNYHSGHATTINHAYVSGISVTHGSPRQHIWTFAAGAAEGNPRENWVCPCDADHTISIPPFVGNDYFCESGLNEPWDFTGSRFYPDDTLWDGEDCLPSSTCCSRHNPPFFIKQLPTSTTDDIEARICLHDTSNSDNIAIELVDLYVQ